MLTRQMVRISAVAIVGFACVIASEAPAQVPLAPALDAPSSCSLTLSGASLTIQAGADLLPFPHDVPCTGAPATTCSEYTYRFTYAGGNISQSFLSVSADLDIYAANPSAAIEGAPSASCAGDSTTGIGVNVCEQRQIRFNEAASTVNASVVVKRAAPRVSTAGARKGNSSAFCLIQGPGVPSDAFTTFSTTRTDTVAGGKCSVSLTVGADGQPSSVSTTPPCITGVAAGLGLGLLVNGEPWQGSNGQPITFGTGTSTCYPTRPKATCVCTAAPCP